MLQYAIIACIFVLAGSKALSEDEMLMTYGNTAIPIPKTFVISPEVGAGTYAVAHLYNITRSDRRTTVHFKLQLWKSPTPLTYYLLTTASEEGLIKECHFEVDTKASYDKVINVNAIRRLSDKKVVLVWYHEDGPDYFANQRLNVINVLDLDICEEINIHDLYIYEGDVAVVPSTANKFDVFAKSDWFCKAQGASNPCKKSYNLNSHDFHQKFVSIRKGGM